MPHTLQKTHQIVSPCLHGRLGIEHTRLNDLIVIFDDLDMSMNNPESNLLVQLHLVIC